MEVDLRLYVGSVCTTKSFKTKSILHKTMKNMTLTALLLSVVVMGGGVIQDANAETNTNRLIDVLNTTAETNSAVALVNTILDGIENVLNDIISLVTGLGGGADALMASQNDTMTSFRSLSDIQKNLAYNQNEIQSKIGDMSTMLDDLETTLLAKMSELETNIEGVAALADRTAGLEAAINDLNTLVRNSQSDTERQISEFEQSLDTKLTSLEARLGGVSDDIIDVSGQLTAVNQTDFSGAQKGTAAQAITLYDYSTNVGEFDYNDPDATFDYNLKFECKETVYIHNLQATGQGKLTSPESGSGSIIVLDVYGAQITGNDAYLVAPNSFHPVSNTTASVIIPDIQLSDIVLMGDYPTIPAVKTPITLVAGDSFTIQTTVNNKQMSIAGPNYPATYLFYKAETVKLPDTYTLLTSKVKIDKDEVSGTDSAMFSTYPAFEKLLKKHDNKPLRDLAKQVEILEISIGWFSGVDDPGCTFTPIGDAVVDYPNRDNTLNVLTTIENIELSATVDCNGIGTRIADIDDIRIGGAITNHDVGTLTLSAGNQSIKLNLNDDLTFRLADDDVDFPLEFTDTLQITGTIVPETSPANMLIEIIYDTAAGNICTQQ